MKIKYNNYSSSISLTAHHTSYTWYANSLSHKVFATNAGRFSYYGLKPLMFLGKYILGISDLESSLIQRHLILNHLLEKAIKENGVTQVLELACGLSPSGFYFKQKKEFRDILYIEADLPEMAKQKKAMLKKAGLLGHNHKVISCNILNNSGPESIYAIAEKYLDPNKPTAVITEGLINYFDLPDMKNMWAETAKIFKSFSGGVYLTDNLPIQNEHPYFFLMKMWSHMLGTLMGSGFYMHFKSDKEAEAGFKDAGFKKARVIYPEDMKKELPALPLSRKPSFLSVMEAMF